MGGTTCVFEYVEHITGFPVRCFVAAIDHSCHHWHADVEILFVLKGQLNVTVDDHAYRLGPGDVVLLNTKAVHSIDCVDGDDLVLVLQFLPDIYESEYGHGSFRFHLNTAALEDQGPKDVRLLQSILAQIGMEVFLKADGSQFFIRSLLYQLIGYLFRYTRYDIVTGSRSKTEDSDLARLKKIVEYIDANYQHAFLFKEVAECLSLSVSQCSRFFKEKMGIPFVDYLHHLQVNHAKELLADGNHTVLYISEACGFSSLASFYRAFRNETGMTPTGYRERGGTAKKPTGVLVAGYSALNPPSGYDLLQKYITNHQE